MANRWREERGRGEGETKKRRWWWRGGCLWLGERRRETEPRRWSLVLCCCLACLWGFGLLGVKWTSRGRGLRGGITTHKPSSACAWIDYRSRDGCINSRSVEIYYESHDRPGQPLSGIPPSSKAPNAQAHMYIPKTEILLPSIPSYPLTQEMDLSRSLSLSLPATHLICPRPSSSPDRACWSSWACKTRTCPGTG